MNRIEKIAMKIAIDKLGIDPLAMKTAEFFRDNPNPSDSAFHVWAEKEGLDTHVAEAAAYRLATMLTTFIFKGRAAEKNFIEKDADPSELSMGISVEKEHTGCFLVAKRIALDHLAEIKDYYTRLKKMEEEAGITD
jgi:hypothetical protein